MKNELSRRALRLVCYCLLPLAFAFHGCSDREVITEAQFVGKWKSSKATTPIYLYDNGEWEVKTEDGAVLQFGVWEYKDRRMTWSYKIGSHIGHDINAVLSATPGEFQVRESDGTTTVFTKLDSQ